MPEIRAVFTRFNQTEVDVSYRVSSKATAARDLIISSG
ncbi:hypothetical protein GGQ80_000768 [Sphingomonas jinjuensis]|uniref:Uncharacterized protein n=1 Tax=Sphingomonas jinjuensis TaxID=535907 RepID=A0A840F4R8_9SPHN|nr:hypothetical protein [Sphingomonas jinjuensis]